MRLRRLLLPLLLLVLGAVPAALAGCGGSDEDAKGLLKTAFAQPIRSADVSMDIELKVDGVEQLKNPITVKLNGPYRSNGSKKIPSADFDLSIAGGGQTFNAGVVSTGDNAFVSFQGTDYEVGEDSVSDVNKQIARSSAQRGKRSLSELGVNPLDWVKDASEEGEEDVAGVKTTHVSGGLDLARLLDDLNEVVDRASKLGAGAAPAPQKLTDQQKKQIESVVKDPKFDVYVGKADNTVRRLSADLKLEVPESARSRLGGAEGGSLSFSIEFANVGGQQKIQAPTKAKPIRELLEQLGGLSGLGSLRGGGTGTTPGGGSTPGGTSGGTTTGQTPDVKQFEKYSECLRKANPNDVKALQKCAEQLR
jgi:hypothetical protein